MAVKYKFQSPVPEIFLKDYPEIHPIVAQILYNRGIRTQQQVDCFFYPDYSRDQHDPYLFKDMEKVVQRIQQAKADNEKVVIYGDYDADGVSSSVILYTALKAIGINNLNIYLPHRDKEGYGLNQSAIKELIKAEINLIITVDCGISNKTEVEFATNAKIDVIITDHHAEPPELPNTAYAILNPQLSSDKYPFAELAGGGVVFKLVQALSKKFELGEAFEKWLLDLVAISTVADCMPLHDENRTLVRYGLVVLNKTKRLGLQKLIQANYKPGEQLDTTSIGFRLAPWINSAGRVDHANVAVELLLAEQTFEADELVMKLKENNSKRQAQTETMYKTANQQAIEQSKEAILFTAAEEWPLGLVGLVAGKLSSKYNKPAFVITKNENEISGSGRSVEGLNLIDTLHQLDELFDRYGGHAMACGFTLKPEVTIEEFTKAFKQVAHSDLEKLDPAISYNIDAKIKLADINWDLVKQLDQLKPFGEGNEEPLFLIEQACIKDFQAVGKTNSHLRLKIADINSTKIIKAIAFGWGKILDQLSINQTVQIVTKVNVNQWNGNQEIQLQVCHMEVK